MIRNSFLFLLLVSTVACTVHMYAGKTQSTASNMQLTAQELANIQNECPICMDGFTDSSLVTRTMGCTCKEIGYHAECLLEAFKAKHECPICRTPSSRILNSIQFKAIEEAREDTQKKQQVPQPMPPAPQEKKHLTAHDFEGIAPSSCGLCNVHFTQEDYITKCSCSCKQVYHYHCLINNIENKEAHTCPHCTAPVDAIPDGISFALIKPLAAPQPILTPVQKQPLLPPLFLKPMQQTTVQSPKITLPVEQPLEEPAIQLIKESSHPLLAEALLAFFYGILTERIWSSNTINTKQKAASLGALNLTLVPIQYALHKESPQSAVKRALIWLGGLATGFGSARIVKNIHSSNK